MNEPVKEKKGVLLEIMITDRQLGKQRGLQKGRVDI